MDPDCIHIRIDNYEADISVSSLPELPAPKFRQLLKLIQDPRNTHLDEWDWMEERLKVSLEEAESKLAQAKEYHEKLYRPAARNDHDEQAAWRRKHNRALESDVKQAERLVKRWKVLKTIYDKERNKRK